MTSRQPNRRTPLLPGHGPLAKASPLLAFLVVLALFGLGAWLGGPLGASLLGLLGLAVLGLLVATWNRLRAGERAVRLLVLLILIATIVRVLS